jgi:hypothetical protein
MMDFNSAAAKLGLAGTRVAPYRVGGTSIRPYRVGAPVVDMGQGLGVQPVEYGAQQFSAGGNSYFGLGTTVVAAGAVGQSIQRNPIRPFEPLELRCPSTVIGLLIDQIVIQGIQFFANRAGQGVPIELFSEVSRLLGFEMATIQPDTGIEFIVSNPTGAPLNFSGGLRGTQVRL